MGEGITLNNIGEIYRAQGNPSKALKYLEQALTIRREVGDRAGEGFTCWNLGCTYEYLGDLARAEEYISLTVEIEEQVGHYYLENDRNYLKQLRAKRGA